MTENKDETSRKTKRTKKKKLARDFELLKKEFKGQKPIRYSMSGSFKLDDVIDHKTFGIGIVISTSYKKNGCGFCRPITRTCLQQVDRNNG